MVYSHDAFGLGNIRRMLAICDYLLETIPGLSILVLSGSPALHSLRLPKGLDYIKLPCISRDQTGDIGVTFLDTSLEETVNLRADLILSTIQTFQPDVFLVDKKPNGLLQELQPTLNFLEQSAHSSTAFSTQLVLLLRDILDTPEATQRQWQRHNYVELIDQHYAEVWVAGTQNIFDVTQEYQFPEAIAQKTHFCGYIRRKSGQSSATSIRQRMHLEQEDKLVLVTAGGGGDGDRLIMTYLDMIGKRTTPQDVKSLIVCGYEMPTDQRDRVHEAAANHSEVTSGVTSRVTVLDFSDDLVSLMGAADVVVSMGGYNTVCEILSLQKRAVVVPRIHPVQEQWIRAEQMRKGQLFDVIHPYDLSPATLATAIHKQLRLPTSSPISEIDMNALPRIAQRLMALMLNHHASSSIPNCYIPPVKSNCVAIATS